MIYLVITGVLLNAVLAILLSKHDVKKVLTKSTPSTFLFLGHWFLFLILPMLQAFEIIKSLPLPAYGLTSVIGAILFLLGLGIAIMARIHLGKNYVNGVSSETPTHHRLVTNGIYKHSRNPLYVGKMLFFIGFELILGNYLLLLIVPIFIAFHLAILKEEKRLAQSFPVEFKIYTSNVRRYV